MLAAVQDDKAQADRGSRRPALSSAGACWKRAASRSPRSRPSWKSAPRRSGHEEKASRMRLSERYADGTAHRRNAFALPHVLARGMGGVARRHADDADLGRGRAAALAARPARHRGGRGHLSAAVAPAVALRGGDAAAVPRAAALPRHRRRQDAFHHRRRRLGGGRQVHHRARAAGLAGALAERAQGRSHHHRRLSLSERRSSSAKA